MLGQETHEPFLPCATRPPQARSYCARKANQEAHLRNVLRAAGVVVVALLTVGAYRILFPSDETLIHSLLASVVHSATVRPDEAPLARLANANKLAWCFTREVVLNVDQAGADWANVTGRDQLLQVIVATRSHLQQLRVELIGLKLDIQPDKQSATGFTTAAAEVNGERYAVVQELNVTFTKAEGHWLIAVVDSVDTAARPPAPPSFRVTRSRRRRRTGKSWSAVGSVAVWGRT